MPLEPSGSTQDYRENLIPADEATSVIDHFERRIQEHKDRCNDAWEKSLENHRFVTGGKEQWDKAVYEARENTGRPVFTINDTALGANALAGMEITKRFERVYQGTEGEDHSLAEALTKADRNVRERNETEQYESDKFRDLGIEGIAALEMYQDYLDDYRGTTKVRGVTTWEAMWDTASREFNLLDRMWDAAGRWLSIDEFLALHPDHRDQAVGAIQKEDGWVNPQQSKITRQGWKYRLDGKYVDPARRDVFLVDYQWREREGFYLLSMPKTVTGEDGLNREVVTYQTFNREQWDRYQSQLPFPTPEEFVIKPEDGNYRWAYKRASILGDEVLEEGPSPVNGFTRLWMTGFPFKTEEQVTWMGLVDYMKDPQKFSNAVTSLIVSILERSNKGGLILDPAGWDAKAQEELSARAATPFPMLWTKKGALMSGQKVYEKLDTAPFPDGLQMYMSLAQQATWRPTGMNPNTLGQLEDPRRVSGVVWSSITAQSQVVMGYLFNALRLYRKHSGRLQLSFFEEFYEPDQLREVVGPELGQYIPDKDPENPDAWGRMFQRDVMVDESAATTKDERERLWEFISRQGPMELVAGGVISRKLLVKNMPGISEVDRKEELQRLELVEGIQALQQQLEQLQTQVQQAGAAAAA